MATSNTIKRVDYFYATVKDQPGEAYRILNQLAELGINLQAITVIPTGPQATQMTIFPEDTLELQSVAKKANLPVDGPYPAILVQGNDRVGALVDIHEKLFRAGVNVFASSGVSSGAGYFGYLLYVRPETYDTAAEVLEI